MGNPGSKQGRPDSARGTGKTSSNNPTGQPQNTNANTNKGTHTTPRKQSDVSDKSNPPPENRPKSNSNPNTSHIPLDDSFTEIPQEVQVAVTVLYY